MGVDKRIGFMGSGQMAEALARGLIAKGIVAPDNIVCTDPVQARKDLFRSFGATPYETNMDVSGRKPPRRHSSFTPLPVAGAHDSQAPLLCP